MFHDVLMILLTRFRESRLLSGGGWHGLPQHGLQRQSSVCSHGPGSLCLSTGGASCAIKVKPPARVSVVPLVYHSGSFEYVWVLNGLTQFNILEHNICHIVIHYNIYLYICIYIYNIFIYLSGSVCLLRQVGFFRLELVDEVPEAVETLVRRYHSAASGRLPAEKLGSPTQHFIWYNWYDII